MRRDLGRRGSWVAGLALLVAASAWADDRKAIGDGPRRVLPAAQKVGKKKARAKRPAPAAEPGKETAPAGETSAPAPSGDLKFSRDIAPILVSNCTGCHNPRQKRGKFDLTTFEALMQGTPDEKVIVPGKPEESHLVLRIKGEETPKMPQGANRNLSDEAVARIERWVKAGALLDAGLDPKAPLEKYAATPEDLRKAELARMSPADRDRKVEEVGRERWKKANPKVTPEVTPGTHFLLLGATPKARAAAAVKALEGQYAALRTLIGPAPLEWGEKASLYVFNDPRSFAEFVRGVENREVESSDVATSNFSTAQPYVAVLDPLGGRDEPASPTGGGRVGKARRGAAASAEGSTERSLAGVLTEAFVTGAVGRAGTPPRWLAYGLGAQMASKVEPRASYYQSLRRNAREMWEQGWPSKANEALGDATKAEDVRAIGFAVVEWLSSPPNRAVLPAFVKGMLAGGNKLDEVIGKVLQGSREDFLRFSGEFVGTQYGGTQ